MTLSFWRPRITSSIPKPNGYRSLHLIIQIPIFLQNEKRLMKVEVQLRTIAMEFWGQPGTPYALQKNVEEDILQKTSRELWECAEVSAALDERMQSIRNMIERKKRSVNFHTSLFCPLHSQRVLFYIAHKEQGNGSRPE